MMHRKISRVARDMRRLAVAIEAFHGNEGKYPEWGKGAKWSNGSIRNNRSDAFEVPTFSIRSSAEEVDAFKTLTTPFHYISGYPHDPFSLELKTTYCYYNDDSGWILISPGPDTRYDIDPEREYPSSLESKRYDASNGAVSSGDIFLTREEFLKGK